MLSFDEAIALLDANVEGLGTETIRLEHAAGRFLAEDLHARSHAPRADVSAMDGYAVCTRGLASAPRLRVVGEARPGIPFHAKIAENEAVRIFTGGALPSGADRVIMQEYAGREGDYIAFSDGHGPSPHVRKAGSDFVAGDLLLPSGTRLDARALVAAAAADRGELQVARQPQVAIVATGNELIAPGEAYKSEAGIPESASHGVAAMCGAMGANVTERMHAVDDRDEMASIANRAIDAADCTVVIGGASVGDYDLARPAFAQSGMELLFSRLAIKPGKPVWLGRIGTKVVLGLPGNPTSAMVTARLFLRPLLAKLQGGSTDRELAFMPLPCAAELPAPGDRETFTRARSTEKGLVPAGNQASGAQSPLASSDWLIRRPAGAPASEAGAIVSALAF